MNYDEFQTNIRKAGLTNCEFADLFRMNKVSLSNYAKKRNVPSHLAAISMLLKIMADNEIDFREPLISINMAPKKPRGKGHQATFKSQKSREV